MQTAHGRWLDLKSAFLARHQDVEEGRMMSAEALTHRGKVFCFYSTKGGRVGLGCRVGRDQDVEALGLQDWQHLAPFRTRPPMKDWIVAGLDDAARWERLGTVALELARKGAL
ncbi:MAG: hypothetical protein AAGA78_10160 [Pseudomonadota bacterium]